MASVKPAERLRALPIFVAAVAILSQGLWLLARPAVSLTYNQGRIDTKGRLPLYLVNASSQVKVHLVMTLPAIHPVLYRIAVDDCLVDFRLNGKTVNLEPFESCAKEGVLPLGRALRSGDNVIDVLVENRFGDAQFMIEPYVSGDKVFLPAKLGILALLILVARLLATSVSRMRKSSANGKKTPGGRRKSRP